MIVRKCEMINVSDTRRGRVGPNKTLIEAINKDLSIMKLIKHMTLYRSQ